MKPAQLNHHFETAHTEGVKEFGLKWLRANEAAIEAADSIGVTVSNPIIKTLLSVTVLAVLRCSGVAEKTKGRVKP